MGAAVEEGVAAADVGLEAVELADPVAQVDGVLLAWTSAVLVGRAVAEEDAKDTVLHVKHRHVLVEGELEPIGRSGAEEVEDLPDVEIVGNSEGVETGVILEEFCRDRVGDVE